MEEDNDNNKEEDDKDMETLVCGLHGLNARSSWRTKSKMPEGQKAGPKGRQLLK